MDEGLIKLIAVVGFLLFGVVFKAIKGIRQAMEAERRRTEQGDANAPMAAEQQARKTYTADADQIKVFLEEMGLRSQGEKPTQPQQPQPRRQPAPQQQPAPQPHEQRVNQQATHGAHQQVDQHSSRGVDQQAATGLQQRSETAAPKKAKVQPAPKEALEAAPAGEGAADPMSLPVFGRLSPAQRAIVLADILGPPKGMRGEDDIISRWC